MGSSYSYQRYSFSGFERERATVSNKLYDAFINHRGPDVKDTVAFGLYDSLEEKGFWTFLDDQELQLGDLIESVIDKAIYSSKVQIAMFSPRYADSPWCLNELVAMLKTKALFIPVFCDVKPSDLRYPHKGVYKRAFAKHVKKGRFSKKKIREWKEALRFSSYISGHEFSTSNDNVEMLCSKIASAVQQKVGRYVEIANHEIGPHTEAAATSTSVQVKKSSLLPRDSHPVGIDSKVEEMVDLLEDPKNKVIAVVGMGGSGKTFLLQNVYKALKSRYHYSVWLSISKSYSVKNLQHDIAFHAGLERKIVDGVISEETVAKLIHRRLQGKKCLIVLDDLWTLSTEDNLLDKLGLPADEECKVVVSTRNRKVAVDLGAQVYEMKILSDEESWRLFCAYAFPKCEGNRAPPHMEEEGWKIVRQCGNLPLAIKTIAASLANTTLISKWESKRRQLERAAAPIDRDPVMDILKLSYDSLPAHLKLCFAYFSFFPEDCEIDCEYLIYLWMGEGFIPAGAGEEQWDMAWGWLDQLAQLCLLQLWEAKEEARLTKYCKVHDLLHDLAIHISRQNKCVFSVEEASAHSSAASGWCRILLAKKAIQVNDISESCPTYLRTLSLSQNGWHLTHVPTNLFTSMRGLRVLDLSSTRITTLPASVGKMILLKVLNLRDTQIKEVPECVKYLKSLLFLALPVLRSKNLPVLMSELKCLQHLECNMFLSDRMPKVISKLAYLRTLRSEVDLSIEDDEFMRLEDLTNMTQLQELWLRVNHHTELRKIGRILAQLVKMRRLLIRNDTGMEFPRFPKKMRAMKLLESLALTSFAVPRWICELANLRELELTGCDCSDYPELQRMPNLVRLELYENKKSIELPKAFGKSGGFPSLRFLTINYFCILEEFPELEEGAMVFLEEFRLWNCKKVKKVGEGLERLKKLKEFKYYGSGTNEVREALKEGGEYWNKIIANNPHVTIQGQYILR